MAVIDGVVVKATVTGCDNIGVTGTGIFIHRDTVVNFQPGGCSQIRLGQNANAFLVVNACIECGNFFSGYTL